MWRGSPPQIHRLVSGRETPLKNDAPKNWPEFRASRQAGMERWRVRWTVARPGKRKQDSSRHHADLESGKRSNNKKKKVPDCEPLITGKHTHPPADSAAPGQGESHTHGSEFLV